MSLFARKKPAAPTREYESWDPAVLAEAKAEPGAAIQLPTPDLVEFAENVPLLILRNAGSAIPNVYAQPNAAAAAADHNSALRSVPHRVGYEVQHDSFEQNEIAAHPGTARCDPQAQPLLTRRLRKRRFNPLEQTLDRKLGQVRLKHACVQPRHVQERLEQLIHRAHGGVDPRDELTPFPWI